ncbi:putative Clavata3/esr-related 12 [Hibiscus syriacus]|uniref:Clavata3/esr-related 12 n=1 Tax=Hibiscus syriacus TaxID=106335 RepID=A0A6A2XG80_HIBSY|nr:putative Clavata3/esr-related 12 [Hibiscus syriacus]
MPNNQPIPIFAKTSASPLHALGIHLTECTLSEMSDEISFTKERDKLADPFYCLEHQEEDLKKKKEAEPVLVRLQRVSNTRHSDDYALNKALRAKLRKRVLDEESASRKLGLSIRLLPASEEDGATAAGVKFSSKFERNRKDKRALIRAASFFRRSSGLSSSNKERLELESKRRKTCAAAASNLLTGGFKPSSWSKDVVKRSATSNTPEILARVLIMLLQFTYNIAGMDEFQSPVFLAQVCGGSCI